MRAVGCLSLQPTPQLTRAHGPCALHCPWPPHFLQELAEDARLEQFDDLRAQERGTRAQFEAEERAAWAPLEAEAEARTLQAAQAQAEDAQAASKAKLLESLELLEGEEAAPSVSSAPIHPLRVTR